MSSADFEPSEESAGRNLDEASHGEGRGDAAAGGGADSAGTREFPCESCGAKLEFHIGQQSLACPYCGFKKELTFAEGAKVSEQDLEAALARLASSPKDSTQLGELEITCKGCGASVAFSGQLSTTECAFCGAAVQREDAHRCPERLKVDAVLPFQITEPDAKAKLRRWVQELWFAPTDFKKRGVTGRFNGVFVPHWTYDAMTFCRYVGERGVDYRETVGTGKNRRTVTKTRWSNASGSFERFFDDVAVPATTSFDRKMLETLTPWPIENAKPFDAGLIAGKQAMTYDVDLRTGFSEAKVNVESALEGETRQRIGGDRQRIHSLDVKYSALTYKHTLFPVWMLAYRYQDKSYHVMINAFTEELQGERPWSQWKIFLVLSPVILFGIWYLWAR